MSDEFPDADVWLVRELRHKKSRGTIMADEEMVLWEYEELDFQYREMIDSALHSAEEDLLEAKTKELQQTLQQAEEYVRHKDKDLIALFDLSINEFDLFTTAVDDMYYYENQEMQLIDEYERHENGWLCDILAQNGEFLEKYYP